MSRRLLSVLAEEAGCTVATARKWASGAPVRPSTHEALAKAAVRLSDALLQSIWLGPRVRAGGP